MRVPYVNARGEVEEILNSRDLTDEEWALVKKNKSGVLSARDVEGAR